MLRIVTARTAEDFKALHALFVEYEAFLPEELRHGEVPPLEELAETYTGRSASFIARNDDRPIGCFAVRECDAQTAVMIRLFVRPWERRIGAGRALVARALDFLREQNFARVVLDTHKEQLRPAYDLYRSFGFEDCPPPHATTYRCPTFMERRLP